MRFTVCTYCVVGMAARECAVYIAVTFQGNCLQTGLLRHAFSALFCHTGVLRRSVQVCFMLVYCATTARLGNVSLAKVTGQNLGCCTDGGGGNGTLLCNV